jgi:photosynthetic reaction center H subunit
MYNLVLSGGIDLVVIVTVLFTLFFFGLVLYLRQEDRREGYPLEDDVTARLETSGSLFFTATPKTFILPHDEGVLTKPNADRESYDHVHARRTGRAPGTPLEPTGDPLLSGVGPGSYAKRAKAPDMLFHGGVKIAPLRAAPGFFVDPKGPNPIGMTVMGADRVAAGVVTDVWVDKAEYMIRYLEFSVNGTSRTALVPMPMVVVHAGGRLIEVNALLGSQFANAPSLAKSDEITFDEEERIVAYYGGGLLYATPYRAEPYL